jgi:hypothetical protein
MDEGARAYFERMTRLRQTFERKRRTIGSTLASFASMLVI